MTASEAEASFARRFRRLIELHGPQPVARYIGESNAAYYASRDPLGARGDFVTAPEISQMFGELIGLWLADLWRRAGAPADAVYVELGPGRGTLARDALRAMASQGLRPKVHCIEGSPALRAAQRGALGDPVFHDSLDTLPEDCPLLVVANEFLDALPVRQIVRTSGGWRERMVGMADGGLAFVAGPSPIDDIVPPAFAAAPVGTVLETSPAVSTVTSALAQRIDRQGGAALLIDYGHLAERSGSTLQAVRAHEKVDVFAAPGDMDLTAHVDFAAIAQIAAREGVACLQTTQGRFLEAMGIAARASSLSARWPERAEEFESARRRLAGDAEMGNLFKVCALSARDWPRGLGFATAAERGA